MEFDKEKIKLKIAISNIQEESDVVMENKWKNVFKMIGTAAAVLVLGTGIVFAVNNVQKENKKRESRDLGRGVDTAVENGYIAEPEMDYIKQETVIEAKGTIVDNVNTQVKINSFLMDDYNISTEFELAFGEELEDYIGFNEIRRIVLKDLVIKDEESRILNKNSGRIALIQSRNEEFRTINLMYNLYGDILPKSRKLNYAFHKIILMEEGINENDERAIILTGDWEMDVDVPEVMYNRIEDNYQVVSCDNPDIEIYTMKVTDTCSEIGLIVNNTRDSQEDVMETIREYADAIDNNDNEKKYELSAKSLWKYHIIDTNGDYFVLEKEANGEKKVDASTLPKTRSYIENENGEKFYWSESPSRRQNRNYLEGNQFDFYETFELTKADATDKLTMVLYYYGEPVTIKLEKIK